jgi:tetratricopeptide (TPR) repeat protein
MGKRDSVQFSKGYKPVAKSLAGLRFVVVAALLAGVALPARAYSAPSYTDTIDAGDSLAGNYLSAVVAGNARDTSAAAFFYSEALRDDPRSNDLIDRAFVSLLAEGTYPEATRLADRIIQRDPTNALALLALSARDLRAKNWQKARTRLTRNVKGKVTSDLTGSLLSAWAWLGSGNLKKALAAVDGVKGEDSVGTFRDFHAGLIADLGGDAVEAEKRLAAAYKVENKTLRMVDVYARFLARHGKTTEAKAVLEDFNKSLPRHPVILDTMKRIEEGKPIEPAVASVAAGAAEVLYGLGAAGNRQGDELAAMLYLRLALWLEPNNGLAVITLADVYDRLKQPERANDTYDLVAQGSPLRRSADLQIALNLEVLERKDEAIQKLEKVIAEDPKDIDALNALGNIYRARKDFANAATTYTKALDAIGTPDAGYWSLYYFRGIAFERTKQWPKAEADFKKALELYPEQPMVLNYLGYSWVDQGLNLDEAFAMLKRAVEQRPTDGYIVDSLGWAYYRLGRYDEATRILEKAVELKPSDPVINDHLGDSYYRVGRKLEATFQWNHARDLKPDPDDLPAILKKIERGGLDDVPQPAAAEAEKKANGG